MRSPTRMRFRDYLDNIAILCDTAGSTVIFNDAEAPSKIAIGSGMSYTGGKAGSGVYQTIINQIPPHELYIEAFAGGAAILQRKRPARSSIAIDVDAGQVNALREYSLPGLTVICGDAISLLSGCIAESGVAGREIFVYLDPPYLFSVRSSQRALYAHEFGRVEQHRTLLKLIKSLNCMVMISGYWSELYSRELSDWRTLSFQSVVRSGEVRDEWLWMNYPEPLALHDYSYLGDNYRERERITRKKNRWVNRLRNMDTLERRAVLWGLRESGVFEGTAKNGGVDDRV